MSKTITIDGTDRTSIVRLAGQTWSESAERGSVGVGGFDLSDEGASVTITPLKAITVDESAAGTTRSFTGYIADPSLSRGPYRVGSDRAWDVDVLDANTLLDDRLLFVNADRPEETDFARVTWLLSVAAMTGITAGVVPNTNTVTMDAIDYRGAHPRRVLDECAEMAGKNYFLYRFGSGPLLYYDLEGGTSLSSSARFSSVVSDVDNATTWGAAVLSHKKETGHVYSRLRMTYANGSVWVKNATTASTYRQREISFTDKSIKTEAKAITKATKYLAAAALPTERFTLLVRLPAANVNDIRAGQRAEIKIPHLGIAAFTFYRCVSRTVEPARGRSGVSDVLYDVQLEFAKNAFPTRFREQHSDDSRVGTGGGGTEVGGDGGGGGVDGGSGGHGADCDDCNTPWDPDGTADGGNCNSVVYDNFNRTVAADGWGDATPGGNTWSRIGTSGTASYAVDGSRAYVEATTFATRQIALMTGDWEGLGTPPASASEPEGPWHVFDYDVRVTFRVTGALGDPATAPASDVRSIDIGVASAAPGVRVFLGDSTMAGLHGSPGRGIQLIDDPQYTGSTAPFVAKTIALDTDYIVRWDRRGNRPRCKMWPASESEPAKWDIVHDHKRDLAADFSEGNSQFDIRSKIGNTSGPDMRVEYDSLTFTTCEGPSSGKLVAREAAGVGDGSETTFHADFPFKAGSLKVFVDGIDVTHSVTATDPSDGEFTLDFAPEDDEEITVEYTASGRQITNETIGGGDASTTLFTTGYPYRAGSLTGYVDDVDTALTETDPDTGTFTFDAAPATDTVITADYIKQ